MKKKLFYVVILFALVGCTRSPLSKVQQEVEAQVRLLIDSGLIQNKYVVLYEHTDNGSSHIYRISDSEFPVDNATLELPSKIVSYKDKYLCFIELDEPEMSFDELKKITCYSGNPMIETEHTYKWFLAVSEQGQESKLVDFDWEKKSYLDYTELWPHFSGYSEDCPVQMGVVFHDIETYSRPSFTLNVDSVRQQLLSYYIKSIYGRVYLKNNTDSVVSLSSSTKKHYAVINNRDSLYLSLCDSLPIILGPHERKEIRYVSIPSQQSFFERLSKEEDPWEYFYNLFCKSTYCLMKINHKDLVTRVMFLDCACGFEVTTEKGESLFRLLKHGIYDKDERIERNVKLWVSSE